MGAGAAAWTLGFLDTKSDRLEKYLRGRKRQEKVVATRFERDQLTFHLQEITSARETLTVQLDTAQQALNVAHTALAGEEKKTQLLTERLSQAEKKIEKLEQDRLALLTDKAELQALATIRTNAEKERTQ